MQLLEADFRQMELTPLKKVYNSFSQMAVLFLITMFLHRVAFAQQSFEFTKDSLLFDTSLLISSFGVDENLDLYVMGVNSGQIYRFTEENGAIILTDAFPNLNFEVPGFLTYSPDSTDRIFVLEIRSGKIFVFSNDPDVIDANLFLDIWNRFTISAFEGGLLGLAFHPDYAKNGYVYINYTAGYDTLQRTVLSRFPLIPQIRIRVILIAS